MSRPFFSVIIPVFNRAWCVERAVDSAVMFGQEEPAFEIVLVDDASTDNSSQVIQDICNRHKDQPGLVVRSVAHASNRGVCAAKNSGARAASGQWLIFLDSDDELIAGTAAGVREALSDNSKFPLHFFKCVSEKGEASAGPNKAEIRDFSAYFRKGTDGEALPIVAREVFLEYPYDEDLRGFESLSYLRIVSRCSAAIINSLEVRRYYTSHDDRLSSRRGMAGRYRDLAVGNRRVINEHRRSMTIDTLAKQWMRLFKYELLSRLG
jgi:glycosyltransferase involved in cell wall biosynthesis